jgi:AraC-like DNA-binding protein
LSAPALPRSSYEPRVSILDTLHQAGYFDQPHLTRSLKYFIGQTPAQIMHHSQPEQLSFLYKTTLFY